MDADIVGQLEAFGFETDLDTRVPYVPLQIFDDGRVDPITDDVPVHTPRGVRLVRLQPVAALFRGDRQPPCLERYPEEYVPFFATIERTAHHFVACTNAVPTDNDFERLYRRLRRHPDGRDEHPLFSYLRAAVRLYMSLRDTSEAELHGVLRRLERCARSYAMSSASRNYFELSLRCTGEGLDPADRLRDLWRHNPSFFFSGSHRR